MIRNIICILQIRKKGCRDKNNRETIRTGKCSMTLWNSLCNCWTNGSSCLLAYHGPNWFFFSFMQSLLPRPVSLLHILISFFIFVLVSPCFSPSNGSDSNNLGGFKDHYQKGFSLLWFPIITGIPFPHHVAASLITSNTERARHAALWAEPTVPFQPVIVSIILRLSYVN